MAPPSVATDRLKIVFVSHAGERSGAPIVLTRLFEQALREKEEAFLVFRYGGSWAETCKKEFGEERVFILPGEHPRFLSRAAKPFRKLCDLRRLTALFKRIRPEMVVANSLINTSAVIAGLWVGSRVAIWAHEVPGMINDPWNMRSFWIKKAHWGFGVSQEVCTYLQALGMDPWKIRLLHHGVRLEKERAGSLQRSAENKRSPNTLILGALAVWSPRKRLDLTLETAYAVARVGSFEEVRLDIGGPVDPMYPHFFQETLDRFPARPQNLNLRFLGPVEDRDLFYKELDALLMTSERESLPTVVLEALVREIPVFSFEDLSGVQEIMGDSALVVKERAGTALAQKIVRFFLDPDFPEAGRRWRETARLRSEMFSLERQWKIFKEYIRTGN